jgi:peptide deformylase
MQRRLFTPAPSMIGAARRAASAQSPLDLVRVLGDPVLHAPSRPVESVRDAAAKAAAADAHAALAAFRVRHGFGRAISAPQVGHALRVIALDLGAKGLGRITMFNPVLSVRTDEPQLTLWDDCMSVPGFLVRLRRYADLDVDFLDERGEARRLPRVGAALAELLQHEVDHLDGITVFDRLAQQTAEAAAPDAGRPAADASRTQLTVVHRDAYERDRRRFDAMVSYAIVPTV